MRAALTPRLNRFIPHAPTPPQTAFLLLPQLEAFYGGAAGGGKSDALLMASLQYVDVPGYAALILRRTFPELSQPGAIMARSHEWLTRWKQHGVTWNEQKKRWTFPGGATLTFGYLKNERDVYQYQGAEFQFIALDELTQFTEAPYVYLFSRLRRLEGSGVPLRMRSASNPGNVGHGWVKRRFVTPDATTGRVFIPAKLSDNPHLDATAYADALAELSDTLRAQLLNGDWGAFEGMAFTDFHRDTHVVPRVDVLDQFKWWDRFEAMDHGVGNPTAWGAFAVDGDGNAICFDLHYQANELPDHHAALVKQRRADFWERRNEDGWPERHVCYGDPASIAERTTERNEFGDPMTLQDVYQRHGVRIVPANNRRRIGYVQVCDLLKPDPERRFPLWHPKAGGKGSPRLFIVGDTCPELVEQLETAPIAAGENDPERGEAVDGPWERQYGHAIAMLRYGLTTRFGGRSAEPKPALEDPRAAAMQRRREKTRKPRSKYIDL